MPARSLSELVLLVRDVPRAAAFYRDLVGLVPARPPSDEWAWFWVGDPAHRQRLAVHKGPLLFEEFSPRPQGQRFGPVHFVLEVDRHELLPMIDRLRRAAIPVHGPQRLEWMSAESYYFYDPDDNLLEFWSPDPTPAPIG